MSPECRNCGSFVTARYVRVFSPPELDGEVRACPNCTAKRTRQGEIRQARARQTGQEGEVADGGEGVATDGGQP
jgi:hypothetical protein